VSYYVLKNGKQEGPYDELAVRELFQEGTYHETDPAMSDGMTEWRPLGELLGVQPSPSPLPPPLPQAPTPPPVEQFIKVTRVNEPQTVVVTDISMPFGSMVIFILKWTLAAIPALFILGGIAFLIWLFFFVALVGAMSHSH